MHRETKGFTLIEMLVVIAIIGILSSVILTALVPARKKAQDARIVEEVNQARAIAETLNVNGNYAALPSVQPNTASSITDPNLRSLAEDIATQGGGLYIEKSSLPPYSWYIIFSTLNTLVGPRGNEVQYYCVDNSGHSVYTTINPDGYTGGCPAGS